MTFLERQGRDLDGVVQPFKLHFKFFDLVGKHDVFVFNSFKGGVLLPFEFLKLTLDKFVVFFGIFHGPNTFFLDDGSILKYHICFGSIFECPVLFLKIGLKKVFLNQVLFVTISLILELLDRLPHLFCFLLNSI